MLGAVQSSSISEAQNPSISHFELRMLPAERNSVRDILLDLERTRRVSCVLLSTDEPVAYDLQPEEKRLLSGKEVEKRRSDFLAGRAAANRALRNLGIEAPGPVLQGKVREPLWPDGIVGSITHSHPWTIVAASRRSAVSAIGIDLESSVKIRKEDISGQICTELELVWIRGFDDPSRALGMIFSSKEAVFKAFSPHCGRYFEFKDAQLAWIPEKRAFCGELLVELNRKYTRGYEFQVHCRTNDEWIFAYLVEDAK